MCFKCHFKKTEFIWKYQMRVSQYVIFTENSDFTLSNDPRLITNFFITKVQLSTLVSTQEELSEGYLKKISSDYGSGAFPPTINPMKWEPRTPLSEGPRPPARA